MNLLQIRTKARRKLDELTAKFWSDDELDDYINETYRKIWELLIDNSYRKALKVANLNLVANTRTVALPSDYVKTRLIEHLVGSIYYPCKYYERYDTPVGSDSSPSAAYGDQYSFSYSFLGDSLVFEPTPINSETGSIRLTYFYIPDYLEDDTDEPDIPSLYHDLFVLGCVIQAKEKEEMIGGGGASIAPFVSDYADLWDKFLNSISKQSQQRTYSQAFGVY
jgi:hypothetical protein